MVHDTTPYDSTIHIPLKWPCFPPLVIPFLRRLFLSLSDPNSLDILLDACRLLVMPFGVCSGNNSTILMSTMIILLVVCPVTLWTALLPVNQNADDGRVAWLLHTMMPWFPWYARHQHIWSHSRGPYGTIVLLPASLHTSFGQDSLEDIYGYPSTVWPIHKVTVYRTDGPLLLTSWLGNILFCCIFLLQHHHEKAMMSRVIARISFSEAAAQAFEEEQDMNKLEEITLYSTTKSKAFNVICCTPPWKKVIEKISSCTCTFILKHEVERSLCI